MMRRVMSAVTDGDTDGNTEWSATSTRPLDIDPVTLMSDFIPSLVAEALANRVNRCLSRWKSIYR